MGYLRYGYWKKNPRTKKTREYSAKTIGCRSFEDKETNFVERYT